MIIKALPEHEIMRRARWLVENLAVPERRGSMVYRSYTNSVITVVWETPHPDVPYGPDYPDHYLRVENAVTREVLGSYLNENGGPPANANAEEILKRLKQAMVLDELAFATK